MVSTVCFMAAGSLTAILTGTAELTAQPPAAAGEWYMLAPPLPAVAGLGVMGALVTIALAVSMGEMCTRGLPRCDLLFDHYLTPSDHYLTHFVLPRLTAG